jgi:predicted O-methyltransferase YrrM
LKIKTNTGVPGFRHVASVSAGLPTTLLTAIAEGSVFNSLSEKTPLHSNISQSEAETLYNLVREVKPTFSVEVGFAQGISAMAILKGLADNKTGIHHVIYPFQGNYEDAGLAMVERAGLDSRLKFHCKFAEEVIPSLPCLQFGFIDSSHFFDLTLQEFVMVDRKLDVGGMIAFHDMWMPSLQRFLRYVLAKRNYKTVRDFDSPGKVPIATKMTTFKRAILSLVKFVPGKEKIFREEILRPWHLMSVPNLVVI